ncbi:hypothetical protein CBA19CS22_37730 [Caballeronia novacaledonica]|uniref:Uncharacterized protein n=1 Tax=Caballeronia novacaledonica TaxID=1544861 RepID=A0ACB5R6D8_9BURK|nr:hypothetical protein CBA19CS22_37730 [Caballeronia novacaledonica]
MGTIYVITCTETGKQYVGLTRAPLLRRWTEHKSAAKSGSRNTRLSNAIRKYGADAFRIDPLEEFVDDEMLVEREIHWISVLDTFKSGYNLTSGGEVSKEWSEESRLKVSIKTTGRIVSEERRRQLSEWAKERRHSHETKQKMSAWQLGKRKPAEVVAKVAEARRIKLYIDGFFYNGLKCAAAALGVQPDTISGRLKRGVPGYVYAGGAPDV